MIYRTKSRHYDCIKVQNLKFYSNIEGNVLPIGGETDLLIERFLQVQNKTSRFKVKPAYDE